MRHDYDLPPDWDALTAEEKSRWMTQERCRRQAMQQGTSPSKKLKAETRRRDRVLAARGYEPVKQKR
ncbi:hypothetical protein EGH24_04740 [Halonotius terrestris]|uniref:Uncharacterized protein n=1 Tax=Halonotius terrestris TaxID=2487750 RepID=A0A8J8P9M0_9EURY|nr:hypothetical protein [Halonotius terrestris]TQQ82754.1 hypothetical protein EGH24_04740 [Halonotius terrestris]